VPRALIACTIVLASGCGSSSKRRATKSRNTENVPVRTADARKSSAGATDARAATATNVVNDYMIMPSDILEIAVFQEPDLKSTLRVSNEGTIAFPLIGVVPIGGLTPQGAAQAIRDRLAKGYLVNPQVSVTVMEFSKRRFTVLGEVQKPGSYDMPAQQDITVLQAIGMAGGYTRIANPSKVTLMRRQEGKSTTFPLNAKSMASGNSESAFIVQPGDVITVAESRF
jgi:protein involved in polysaccharide export with SLBB domain